MGSIGLFRSTIPSMIVLLFLPCVLAQQSGQGGGGTGSGGTSGGSQPGSQDSQGQIISGVVVLDDGTPPPFGTVIERDCGNGVTREAAVVPTGYFSFQVSSRMNIMLLDASEGSEADEDPFGKWPSQRSGQSPSTRSMLSPNLSGCELRARLNGYRSSTVRLEAEPSVSRHIDIGTIVLYPIAKVQGTVVSVTSLQAPRAAKKAMRRTQKAFQKKDFREAENSLKAALEVYPKYAEAWFGLGQVYEQQQRNQEARSAYTKAIEADKMYVSPYIRLARLAGLEQKWQEVADFTDRALALNPLDFPEGYFFNALAHYSLNDLDAAEKSARMEQRLDAGHRIPQIHLILANIRARKHDIAGSTEEMRNYLKFAPTGADADRLRALLQEREKLFKGPPDKQPEQ